jgi:AraC family transcriptional activator of pobA
MNYRNRKTKHVYNEERDMQSQDYPLHDLGDAFFEITALEDADEYFFKGVHRHDFYELLWFTDVKPGQVHYIDFNRYQITKNQVFLLLPGQVHSMEQRDKRGFLMAIAKDFFEKQISSDILRFFGYTNNFTVVVPDGGLQVLNTLMDLIRMEYDGARRPAILESYLRSWLLHCIELHKQISDIPHSNPRMQVLTEFIETHFRKQRHAEFYARQLSISAKRLNELTRESFGKTISQMITDRLILEAKREIGYIEKPIKEISYELGFSEPSYFTRFFGKQTGYAPQDFRKRIAALKS